MEQTPMLTLSFDDGPNTSTTVQMLDVLGRYQIYQLLRSAKTGGFTDQRGRIKSAKGVGGEEPETGAKQAAYAPGEGSTASRKGGGESFLSGWLIWLHYCAILFMDTVWQIGI